MDRETILAALARWVEILTRRGDRDAVEGLFAERATIRRFEAGPATEPVEILEGWAAITEWVGRTREGMKFSFVKRSVRGTAPEIHVRYRLAFPDFKGGGRWRVWFDREGMIAEIEHHPDVLAARYTDPKVALAHLAKIRGRRT